MCHISTTVTDGIVFMSVDDHFCPSSHVMSQYKRMTKEDKVH